MLRAHPEWHGAVFLLGADEFADFLGWKEPEEVLRRVRLGVATRPGYPREQSACSPARDPERVLFFDLEPLPIASRELRARSSAARTSRRDLPRPCWAMIERDGLYGSPATLEPLDVTRTGTPHRGAGAGEACEGRRHPRHAAGVQLHRLLRRLHGEQPAADQGRSGTRSTRRLKQRRRAAAAIDRRRVRGDVDRRRLPRRRAARLHAGRARLLPARRSLGRRAAGNARGGER